MCICAGDERARASFPPNIKIRKAGVTPGAMELAEKIARHLWDDRRYEDHRR